MRYCSAIGCRREAKPEEILCPRHLAARRRSSAARQKRGGLMAPGLGAAIRRAAYQEVLEQVVAQDHGCEPVHRVRQWLEERLVDNAGCTQTGDIDPHSWCQGCGHTYACRGPACKRVGTTHPRWVGGMAHGHAFDCPNQPGAGNS